MRHIKPETAGKATKKKTPNTTDHPRSTMTLVFFLVASVVAQPGTPRPCLYPRQFTAQVGS